MKPGPKGNKSKMIREHPDLGKISDKLLAQKVGTSLSNVCRVRRDLGIPIAIRISEESKERRIREHPSLGKITDGALAKELGVCAGYICRVRLKARIPPAPKGIVPVPGSKADEIVGSGRLGRVEDTVLAVEYGVCKQYVFQLRRQYTDLPKFTKPLDPTLTALTDQLGLRCDNELAREYGVDTWRIRDLRQSLQIPAHHNPRSKLRKESFYNLLPDKEVGSKFGVSGVAVCQFRRHRGIPIGRKREAWIEQQEVLT